MRLDSWGGPFKPTPPSAAKQLAQAREAAQQPEPGAYLRRLGWSREHADFIAMLLRTPEQGVGALPGAVATLQREQQRGRDRR